jgi:hypothetical protein
VSVACACRTWGVFPAAPQGTARRACLCVFLYATQCSIFPAWSVMWPPWCVRAAAAAAGVTNAFMCLTSLTAGRSLCVLPGIGLLQQQGLVSRWLSAVCVHMCPSIKQPPRRTAQGVLRLAAHNSCMSASLCVCVCVSCVRARVCSTRASRLCCCWRVSIVGVCALSSRPHHARLWGASAPERKPGVSFPSRTPFSATPGRCVCCVA